MAEGSSNETARPERSGSTKKIGSGLLALSSAAVLTVYAAGYVKTRAAADRFAVADRRPSLTPAPPVVSLPPLAATSRPAAMIQAPAPERHPVAPASSPRPAAVKPSKRTVRRAAAASTASSDVPVQSAAPATPPSAPIAATPEPVPAADAKPVEAPPPPKPALKDGTYSGWGTSRHGDIQASVVIEDGRIVSASITQCLTRYSCSWIEHLPGQIVSRQSPECDFVSGATQSTNAFYYAIVEALAKAK